MKKLPNELKFLIIIILVVGVAILAKTGIEKTKNKPQEGGGNNIVNTEPQQPDFKSPATVDPIPLPEDLIGTIGFQPKQLDRLSSHYVLRKYETGQDSIIYYYQTNMATNGERFMVCCSKMSQADYDASIPTINIKSEEYNGINITYSERWLYSVPNDYEIDSAIQDGIDKGIMEVEYGNTLKEMIQKNSFYWYDSEAGIKYEIQVRNQNLPYDDMLEIVKKIIDAE